MSGNWIALGWLLAGIGFFGLWLARRQKRIDALTHAAVVPAIAVAMLVLAVGQGWQKYQSDTAQTQISNELNVLASEGRRIKDRARTLQERIGITMQPWKQSASLEI